MKAIHRMGGTVLFCLSTGALLLGLCTQWFQENVAFNFWLVSIVGVAISGLYVVLKPIGTILRK